MRQKTVLHLVDGSTTVGAITSIKKLVLGLSDQRINLIILSYNRAIGENEFGLPIFTFFLDLKFNRKLNALANRKGNIVVLLIQIIYYFIIDLVKLQQFIRKYNIDIVHSHYLNDNFLCSFLVNVKKVTHIRSIVNVDFLGGLAFKLYRYFIFRNSDIIIGISNTVIRRFNFPTNPKKVKVIYNGFDFNPGGDIRNEAMSKILGRHNGKFIVGCVSRFVPEKGLSFLMQVAKKFNNLSDKIHFVVVGPLNNESEIKYRAILEKELVDWDGKELVTFAGSFPNAFYYMPFFSILFLPTLKREGMGNVVLEAHNFSIPVVSTNCGGPTEIIINNESGYILNAVDANEAYEKIYKIYNDKELREFMKVNAKLIAERSEFQFSTTIRMVMECYN